MGEVVKVVAAIDQGTQSTRCIFYDKELNVLASSSKEHKQIHSKPGWCEHDPSEIMECVYYTMNESMKELKQKVPSFEIMGIGITNQRETVIVWDKETGKPLYNAIVWMDIRAEGESQSLVKTYGSARHFYHKTGLLINGYFSAVKIMWMKNNFQWFRKALDEETVRIGTIDSWLIYNLTGEYVTDITNASRTLLMDIIKERWSTEMLGVFGLKHTVLPTILPNCAKFGVINSDRTPEFKGIAILASIGDQQSACVGQGLFEVFATKCTFGTGAFILTNTGDKRIVSSGGLLCTPCYKLGKDLPTTYALEGSIAIVGAGISWLKSMGMIKFPAEISEILRECPKSEGVVFVPAFSGLFAPRWRGDARACIFGMTQHTTKSHIVRAYCESIGFQLREILESLLSDVRNCEIPYICVDGGLSHNSEILQVVADIVDVPLEKSVDSEVTCKGAAILAGLEAGMWSSIEQVKELGTSREGNWTSTIDQQEREELIKFWELGIQRSLIWDIKRC